MLKLDVFFRSKKPAQIEVYRRCHEAFSRRGIQCQFIPDSTYDGKSSASAFVSQQFFVTPGLLAAGRPILIEEKADASMPQSRCLARHSNVVGVSKVSVVRDDWINLPVRRPHTWLLDSTITWPDQTPLEAEERKKFIPGIHFGMADRMRAWVQRAQMRDCDDWKDRCIDVLFIGQTGYTDAILREHRLRICYQLGKLRNLRVICITERLFNRQDYFELSQHAKIVVSPWGYGELCYRDFEGMLDGSVLIKPCSDFVHTLGNMLQSNRTYVPCAADGSNLDEVVSDVLSDPKYRDRTWRQQNRDRVLYWWSEETIVDWWIATFRTALERK